MAEPHTLFAHIFAQTKQNVELLVAHKQISEADGEEILSRLSVNAERRSEGSSIASLTQGTQRLSVSPAPPKVEARAIWDWTSEDPSDLSFEAGEIIEVITETNSDWWTGCSRSGRQGLFPSNYVEKLPPRSSSPIFVPEPRQSVSSFQTKGSAEQRNSSPALPMPYPLPHAPPLYQPALAPQNNQSPGGYYPPAGPPTPQPAAQQQGPAKKSKFGGLGQVMAQSAAGGAGFGAGAAIGSGIVSSLF